MPRKYVRKTSISKWTQESLNIAAEEIYTKGAEIGKVSKTSGIPYRTLKRRIENNNLVKKLPGES
ncbi:hypothetical protein BB559_002002, partial [Furculomyces boomerangus]